MEFKDFFNNYKKKIDRELEDFFNSIIKQAKNISGTNLILLKKIKEFTMRGQSKRIRAMLLILGYKGFGGKNDKEIIKVAPFIEVIHSYLLIHDDIIDRDNLRRGKLTVHKYFEKTINTKMTKEKIKHYGLSWGILAGDLSSCIGYKILVEANISDNLKIEAIKNLNNLINDVIYGQTLDISNQLLNNFSKKDILNIYKYKTAYYSIERPLNMGGILAGADKKILNDISRFALPVGIAFQIKDDILGLFSNQRSIGKPVGSDLKEGKKTLILSIALKRCSYNEKKLIYNIIGKKKISFADILEVRKIIQETSALEFCEKLMNNYINQGKKELERFKYFNDEIKKILFDFFDYIIIRGY